MNEELILWTVAQRIAQVRWTRSDSTVHQFVTISRRVKLFADVVAEQQPSCFQAEHAGLAEQKTGLPYKWTLSADWIIFQNVSRDPAALGAVENNLILNGVREALKPTPQDPGFPARNTLNGLVHHCFIQGRVFKDPGDLDGQGMIVVPIKVLVP